MKHRVEEIGRISAMAAVSVSLCCGLGCKRDPNVQKHKYLESGIRYENNGKYREAGIQFSNAIKIDKNFSEAHYELAKTYLQMGTVMQGYQELMRTVDLNPSNIKARLDLGALLVAGGVPDRALDQAKAVLAIDPNNADAFALRAEIDQKQGEHGKAMADIQHSLTLAPDRSNFHAMLASLETQDTTDPQAKASAEQELRKAVSLDGSNVSARLGLSSLLEKQGDHQGAEQQLVTAIQNAPNNLQARKSLAALYLRDNQPGKAEQVLRKAAADLPDSTEAAEMLSGFYMSRGQSAQAEQAYSELTQQHKSSVPLQIAYAKILLAKQDISKARTVLTELSKTHGQNPEVETLNALLLLKDNKTSDAFTLLQKAVKNSPDNEALQIMLAKTAILKGDTNTAEAAFRAAARMDPGSLDAQSGLATIAGRRGDSSMLAQIAENTIALHPDLAEAYLWRGSAEANQKQYQQADADFQTALKKDPNSIVGLTELGQLRLMEGRGPEGEALLEQALAKDPNATQALNLLVQADLNAKQPARAAARIQQMIARSPNNAALYTNLAILQLTTKDFAGARDNSKRAMDLNASSEDAVQAYSQAEVALGESGQASDAWQKWLAAHPNDPKALVILGTLAEAGGDAPKAIEYYKKVLDITPDQPMAANNLAYLMVETGGNTDVALTLAQTARRAMPDSPNTADTLAWVYYYKGTYSSALDLLTDAEKADPNNASIQYHMGMTYLKLNDKTNAVIHLKKAASLAPASKTGKDAQTALGQMGQS